MIKIFVSGDVVNSKNSDGDICSPEIKDIIKKCDYAVCNFEAPIIRGHKPQPKVGPHLTQKEETIIGLKDQGFKLLLMANNHIMDYGREGLLYTITEIEKCGLDRIGADLSIEKAYKPIIKTINGIKIGIINASEAQFGVYDYYRNDDEAGYAWINDPKIDINILNLKKICDHVIIFSHAGLEGYSIPQKEWRIRYKHLCDLGADIIIGSHPHVPQGYEIYNKSIIFYSLGNFYFDYFDNSDQNNSSYSVIIKIDQDKGISFDLIHHHIKKNKVELSSGKDSIDIDSLNHQLNNNYDSCHELMSLNEYENGIRRKLIYSLLPLPYDGSIKGSIYKILKKLLKKEKSVNKELLNLHITKNESYYFATKHALEIRARREKDEN